VHEGGVPVRQRDRDTGREQHPLAGLDDRVDRSAQVGARVARVRVRRQREPGVQSLDEDVHGHGGDPTARVAAARATLGAVPRFQERLWPPWTWWTVAALLVASAAVAVGYPVGVAAGLLTALLSGAVAAGLLVWWASWLRVDDEVLAAGPARLPLRFVRRATALDAAGAAALRGPGADARAYVLLRPWLPRAVRVDLDDPDDPTPYWYLSTRRPDTLAAVLTEWTGSGAGDDDQTGQDGVG
jgi:hypothetical protein